MSIANLQDTFSWSLLYIKCGLKISASLKILQWCTIGNGGGTWDEIIFEAEVTNYELVHLPPRPEPNHLALLRAMCQLKENKTKGETERMPTCGSD